ncbi:MAG TPA: hypothetical protein PLA30_03190 [Smithellaceae bacterium]|jgi:hypothetical protein|nr:hypothetical protein [Smithellaceae bacterium]HPO21900.1 hypothetical protein [Smithellaceae bacterium]HQK90125.1 hypothetical protein [Smithellaceae bacterium]
MMDALFGYFTAHPTVFTLLTIFVVIVILYFILSKFIKLAVLLLIVILLAGGANLLKDPASMPGKIKQNVQTFVTGGEQIWRKVSGLWKDANDIADRVKKAPEEINASMKKAPEKTGRSGDSGERKKSVPEKHPAAK